MPNPPPPNEQITCRMHKMLEHPRASSSTSNTLPNKQKPHSKHTVSHQMLMYVHMCTQNSKHFYFMLLCARTHTHHDGELGMQYWWTLMSPSPTCCRMLHVCFCHIYDCGGRHFSSSSERCLMRFSSKLSWFQSCLSLTIPGEKFLVLPWRNVPMAAQVFFLRTS